MLIKLNKWGGNGRKNFFLSDFIGIWSSPKNTVKKILKRNSISGIRPLLLMAALAATFQPSFTAGLIEKFEMDFFPALVSAFLINATLVVANYFIECFVIYKAGCFLGGKGNLKKLFVATIWTYPIGVTGIFITWLSAAKYWLGIKGGLSIQEIGPMGFNWWNWTHYTGYFVLVWGFIVSVVVIAEYHRIPLWRALIVFGLYMVPQFAIYQILEKAFPFLFVLS